MLSSSRQRNLDLFLVGGDIPMEARGLSNFSSDLRSKPRFGALCRSSAPSRAPKPSAAVRPFQHHNSNHSSKVITSLVELLPPRTWVSSKLYKIRISERARIIPLRTHALSHLRLNLCLRPPMCIHRHPQPQRPRSHRPPRLIN